MTTHTGDEREHDRQVAGAAACACEGYTIRTDYGTGIEHDVDRSSCPLHGGQVAGAAVTLTDAEREWIALTILDAAAESDTDTAARLIEARIETLIRRRLPAETADRVRQAQAAALREAKDDIKARIDTFRGLGADPQYIWALNDAWGLVANRERARRLASDAAQPEVGEGRE